MAPVPIEHPPSYVPLAVSTAHLGSIVYLTYAVGASLYTSYRSLSPSQDTRKRLEWRSRLAPVFVSLTVVAFSVAAYFSTTYARLSYTAWSDEKIAHYPEGIAGETWFSPDTKNNTQIYLARWLSDTPIYYDALEIVAEKARRFWWGQQVDLATISWSMLLAIEGRRRRIPLLSAFMALAHLVNLSFAQNLFYLALLLTPSPIAAGDDDLELPVVPLPTSRLASLRDKAMPPKPNNWCPHPGLFLGTILMNLGSVTLLPFVAGTPSFVTAVIISRLSTFLPILLPKFAPLNWGTVHPHPHKAYSSYTTLFRILSAASFLLHAKASFFGLTYNTPDSRYHRHSRFLPFDVEERSTWERSTTALGKVLGSTADHPVVAAVGWDALVSALSLGIWTALRATDVRDMISAAVPWYGVTTATAGMSSFADDIADKSAAVKDDIEAVAEEEQQQQQQADKSGGTTHMTLRRRGRPRGRLASVASSEGGGSGASEDTPASSATTGTRRRGGGRAKRAQPESDRAYKPTAQEAREVVEGDVLPPDSLDWESAAVAWGLAVLGGLGTACAGVYGGECVSR